jgi:ADP-heptose:LPS heptosyltransferase
VGIFISTKRNKRVNRDFPDVKSVLIILGDSMGRFVQATGAIADIRAHHRDALIVLLTTPNLGDVAQANPHLDDVSFDHPSPLWNIRYTARMFKFLRQFERIYDLEHSPRSHKIAKLANPAKWSGDIPDCGFHVSSMVFRDHPIADALRVQLSLAGVPTQQMPDMRYAAQNADDVLEDFGLLPKKFTVLVPGSRISQKEKRWPHYRDLAEMLKENGQNPVLVGGSEEERLIHQLAEELDVPLLFNLPLPQLIDVLNKACLVIGNDTGPLHLAVASGTEGILLLGPTENQADPRANITAPRPAQTQILYNENDISAISPQAVLKTLALMNT